MSEPALDGQWAVVTGGTKGIGRAIAHRLAAGGANVVLVARGRESLDEAVSSMRLALPSGQEMFGVVADVADRRSIAELFDVLAERLPHLNIFVANAGTGHVTPFLDLTIEEFDDVLALNLTGAVYGCQRAAQAMVERPVDNQAILAVSSIRALGARPGRLIYAATKAGAQPGDPRRGHELAAARHPDLRLVTRDHRNTVDGRQPRRLRGGRARRPARAGRPARGSGGSGVLPVLAAGPVHHRGQPGRRRR